MTKVTALRHGKWASELATAKEVAEKVQELKGYVSKYGWGEKNIHPYGWAIKIDEFLESFDDYSRCTHSSKQISLAELNGFIEIINAWLKLEEEPKVTIRLTHGRHAGDIKEIPESMVEDYIELGAELVEG